MHIYGRTVCWWSDSFKHCGTEPQGMRLGRSLVPGQRIAQNNGKTQLLKVRFTGLGGGCGGWMDMQDCKTWSVSQQSEGLCEQHTLHMKSPILAGSQQREYQTLKYRDICSGRLTRSAVRDAWGMGVSIETQKNMAKIEVVRQQNTKILCTPLRLHTHGQNMWMPCGHSLGPSFWTRRLTCGAYPIQLLAPPSDIYHLRPACFFVFLRQRERFSSPKLPPICMASLEFRV